MFTVKDIEEVVPVVLFVVVGVFLTLILSLDEILKCDHSNDSY